MSLRIQEMFGVAEHPCIGQGQLKLQVELLSPAQRPIQLTQDIPGFWRGSYQEVKKEMKGRYPKHPWPDDPSGHQATLMTKKRLAQQSSSKTK